MTLTQARPIAHGQEIGARVDALHMIVLTLSDIDHRASWCVPG